MRPIDKRDSQRTPTNSVGWGQSSNTWCSGMPNCNNNYEADDE